MKVRPEADENTVTMWIVNWADLLANDCAVAEEVTVPGGELVRGAKASTKRPTVPVSEGMRQNLDNRKKKFIQPSFSSEGGIARPSCGCACSTRGA